MNISKLKAKAVIGLALLSSFFLFQNFTTSEITILLDQKVFNSIDYAAFNPDLAAGGVTSSTQLQQHWLNYGVNEGRRAHKNFWVKDYLCISKDLRDLQFSNLQAIKHYVQYGYSEKRDGSVDTYLSDSYVFYWRFYLDRNPDLGSAGLVTEEALKNHWIKYGVTEKRRASSDFDVGYYLRMNTDLSTYYGAWLTPRIATYHYAKQGRLEKRIGTSDYLLKAGTWSSSAKMSVLADPLPSALPKDKPVFILWRFGSDVAASASIESYIPTAVTQAFVGLPNISGRTYINGPSDQVLPTTNTSGFTGVVQFATQYSSYYLPEYAFAIDSRATYNRHNLYSPSTPLHTIVNHLDYSISKTPWMLSTSPGIRVSLDLKIPSAGGTNSGGSQLVTYFIIRNKLNSAQKVWLGTILFDTRPKDATSSYIGYDNCVQCTGMGILNFPLLKNNSTYRTMASGSADSSSSISNGYRRIDFQITPANLRNSLNAFNSKFGTNFSTNPTEYEVIHWNLNPEVFTPNQSADTGWLGAAFRNLNISF